MAGKPSLRRYTCIIQHRFALRVFKRMLCSSASVVIPFFLSPLRSLQVVVVDRSTFSTRLLLS